MTSRLTNHAKEDFQQTHTQPHFGAFNGYDSYCISHYSSLHAGGGGHAK